MRLQRHRDWLRYFPLAAALILPLSFAIYLFQIHLHGDAGTKVFASYWASGNQIRAGLNPFVLAKGVWVFTTKSGQVVEDINLNSPVFLPLCQLFSYLPLRVSAVTFVALTTGAFLISVMWMNRSAGARWPKACWAFVFLPVWDSVIIGQNYYLILLPALLIWHGLRTGRQMLSAVALGFLIAFKPNFALVLPILFVAGHGRLCIRAGLAAAACLLLPLLIYGPEIYVMWLSALSKDNHWVFTTTISLPAYFRRLGAQSVGELVGLVTIILGLALAWRRRPDAELATMLGLVISVLASPLAWFHYLLVLLPFLVGRPWSVPTVVGAIAMVVLQPTLVLYAMGKGAFVMATLGGAMLFASLLLAAGIVLEILRSRSDTQAAPAYA
jgi:hypothetical protein